MKPVSPATAAKELLKASPLRPTLAFVLGSGFDCPLDSQPAATVIPYKRVPGYPAVGVAGHSGTVAIGKLGGQPVLVLRGRCHFYEGYPMSSVTFAVRSLAHYGIRHLLLTNAAGGINSRFRPGEFMIIQDHLNFMSSNPLRGQPVEDLPRFVDLTRLYDPDLRRLLKQAAKASGLTIREGIYAAVSGPSYETPAEIKAFHRLGADAVGMSTVPEAIVAHQCGIRVAALSCITNPAAGLNRNPLCHSDVLQTASRVKQTGRKILVGFASLLSKSLREVSD
jgi:purine-nucleoside phosphorylase